MVLEAKMEATSIKNGVKIEVETHIDFYLVFFSMLNASNPEKSVFRLDGSNIFTISHF